MQPICDMDNLIRVSPYAVIYVFRMFIASLVTLTSCSSYISAKSILCISVYVSGLTVLERKQTQSNIAKTLRLVTHDALNRLAEEIGEICHQVALEVIYLLTALSNDGFIILDDVIIPKPFSKWITGVYVDYDCTQKRHISCQRIVVVIWTNGVIYVPLAFAFWHQKEFVRRYRTKNQIARILIYWVVRKNILFSYLTFDNWYASKGNLRFFNRLGIKFVTRLRKNTWIIHDNAERKKVSSLTNYQCHYYDSLNAYVRKFEVKYPRFGIGYLAIVKNDKHEEPGKTKYLFTNDPSLTNAEIVLRYRSRWHIEIFFRTCKQSFGLCSCQAQMMPQVILHVYMVFLAYTLTQLLKSDKPMSMEQMQKHLRSLHILYCPKEAPKLVTMQEDGLLTSVSLEDIVNPIRTKIPSISNTQIPDFTEFIKIA
jgi:hypothetical protein